MTGDEASVSVLVRVPPADAFRLFTEDINQWWRSGVKYRAGAKGRSVLHLEAGVGGRLFESLDDGSVIQTGTVRLWEPPHHLVLEWRAMNFVAGEKTEVEVRFDPSPSGTLVSVKHRGFSHLRPDHPVRHGLETTAFIRMRALWWGDLMSSLRALADP